MDNGNKKGWHLTTVRLSNKMKQCNKREMVRCMGKDRYGNYQGGARLF